MPQKKTAKGTSSKPRGFKSMQAEMLAIIVPIVTALVIVLITVSYNVSKNMIKQSSEELLQSSVASQASKIKDWVDQNLGTLSSIKQTVERSNFTDADIQNVLDGFYGYDTDFPEGIYIASADGKTYKASDSEKIMTDFQNAEWYKHGLTTVNMSITTPYQDADGAKIISATGMLVEDSDTVRVIGADMSLDAVTIIVNSSISMEGATSFLVDSNDMAILAHRDNALLGTTIGSDGSKFMSKVADKLNARQYDLFEIEGNMTCIKEVGSTGWILVSYIPDSIIFADSNKLENLMLIIGIVSVVLLAFVLSKIIKYLVKPIAGLTKNITDMSSGDFTIKIDNKGQDEIAVMGRSLDSFSGSMRHMIADIRQAADDLSEQSETSSDVANNMYEAAKIQGQSMTQLKDTVNQLSESVNEIAGNATVLANVVSDTREKGTEADEKIKQTVEVSIKAKREMEEVGSAMDKILENMNNLQEAINKVGKSSEEITEIIGLIGEIADETNLLSLNASIEAARAGEAGKGFAVVASQIGKLAATSTESVNTIGGLIEQVRDLVADAVAQANNSAKNIDESSASIKGSVDTFDEIYNNIQETNVLIKEFLTKIEEVDRVATNVAAVSEEQAASSQEILATSETMVEQADNITENSQKVADDSTNLAKTSESLSEHMSKFNIESEED